MRSALFVVIVSIAACGAGRSKTPHWPKQTVAETDGGESLEPHKTTTVAAKADADDDDDKPAEKSTSEKADKPEAKPETTTSAPSTATSAPDEAITTEDIVIEIEDD
ncbi:MAG TPA: hypothetical protein VFQ53_15600 [Kofleriaceae bacterium]|nr:hypothetical protein [Kofleriaceae bacterium]